MKNSEGRQPKSQYCRFLSFRSPVLVIRRMKKNTRDGLIRFEDGSQRLFYRLESAALDIWESLAEGFVCLVLRTKNTHDDTKTVKMRMPVVTRISDCNVEQCWQSSQTNYWCPTVYLMWAVKYFECCPWDLLHNMNDKGYSLLILQR